MGKRKSTRRGKKPKTDARQVIRRPTAVHKPATGEQRRVGAPGGKAAKRSSVDMGLGVKYSAVVATAIIVVTAGAVFSVTGSMKRAAETAVIDNCLETAKVVADAARPALEEGTAGLLKLTSLGATSPKVSDRLRSAQILDVDGQEVSRHPRGGPGIRPASRSSRKQYTLVYGTSQGKPAIAVEMPVYSEQHGRVGTVVVIRDASRLARVGGDVMPAIIFIGAGVLAVAVFLTFMLAGRTGEEMGKVDVQMRRMGKQLRSAKETEARVESIEHDLDAAREIQASLLPSKIPQLPGYDIYPFYRSAKEVGGDYYDFFPIDKANLAMVVADVSGKGIPGSMVMATTRTLLRLLGPQCRNAPTIMQQTNAWVAKDIKRGMFVTALFALLNVHGRQMSVCSAGHNPMVLFRERTGQIELVNPNGIALGFDAGPIFDRTLKERRIALEPGDRVVLYTDGVVEAMSPAHEEYGDERFYQFVREHARMRSKDFVLALVRDLDEHKAGAEQHDDITISTFRVM